MDAGRGHLLGRYRQGLHDRIVQLDRAMVTQADEIDEDARINPVATQINALEQAFATGLRRAAVR